MRKLRRGIRVAPGWGASAAAALPQTEGPMEEGGRDGGLVPHVKQRDGGALPWHSDQRGAEGEDRCERCLVGLRVSAGAPPGSGSGQGEGEG